MASKYLFKRFFYGWVVVAVLFVIMTVGYAIWYSFPIFYVPILEEFGWSRANTAIIFSTAAVAYGAASPISGALVDKFGPSRVFPAAAIILAMGLVGSSQATEIWQFCLWFGLFAGFGVCSMGFVPSSALISRWFVRRRASAIGVAQAGSRESFVFAPLIQMLILTFGWRDVYLILAASTVIIVIPLAMLYLRDKPESLGLLPDGADPGSQSAVQVDAVSMVVHQGWNSTEWTLWKSIRTYRFWALFTMMISIGVGYNILLTHQVAFAIDIGFSAMFAASLVLVYGVACMLGRLCGFVSDRTGREITYTFGTGGIVLGIVLLVSTGDSPASWVLYTYAIFFGFFSGLNSPTYVAAAADIFQGKSFGAILGLANLGYGLGTAFGAWLGGFIFDLTGSYNLAFTMSILAAGLACLSIWVASPRRIRVVAGRMPKEIKPA